MNTLDANDPRLTAYALGELDARDVAALEAMIAEDDSLRAVVDDIRRTADVLSAEYAAEPGLNLSDDQRRAIEEAPAQAVAISTSRRLVFRGRTIWLGTALAAAACLVFTFVLMFGDDGRDRFEFAAQLKREQDRARAPAAESPAKIAQFADKGKSDNETTSMRLKESTVPATSPPPPQALSGALADQLEKSAGQPSGPSATGEIDHSRRKSTVTSPPGRPNADSPVDPQTRDANLGVDKDALFREAGDQAGERHRRLEQRHNTETYKPIEDNPFIRPIGTDGLSTFSIDVDTASFSNMRRFIVGEGRLPEPDSVRIEEMLNYFTYSYEPPSGDDPFSVNLEVNSAPWNPEHRLVRVGLKGRDVKLDMRPATSLVFLIDVSGSMNAPNKLPLVKQAMTMLIEKLLPDDRIAIVTYQGNAGLALDSMYVTLENKPRILETINQLQPGGSTNGGGGIVMAYDQATEHFIKGGVNRVILCTDGDFNVGVAADGPLEDLIVERRKTGVFLSVLGFGAGNLQDAKMEMLADKGNGAYAYIDSIDEAKKVLIDQMAGTLVTIAKDVKIQLEFNPTKVGAYRLIGYENRTLEARDFRDDSKDAGEIGAGHTVTALYEIAPPGGDDALAMAPELPEMKYQNRTQEVAPSNDLLTVKLRYKAPDGEASTETEFVISDDGKRLEQASADFKFAAAVASFGMILRDSPYKGSSSLAAVLDLAQAGRGEDKEGYRAEFVRLVEQARQLRGE